MRPEFDDKDQVILDQNMKLYDEQGGPRVGDWIDFADGVSRRISYAYEGDSGWRFQTSDAGSWYLGLGLCSFSGSLYDSTPYSAMTLTQERRDGAVWFFHHDHAMANNAVHAKVPFRVYKSSLPAPK